MEPSEPDEAGRYGSATRRHAGGREGVRLWGPFALVVVLFALAYRRILLSPEVLAQPPDTVQWLFDPEETSVALTSALATWLLWRRRGRFGCFDARGDGGIAAFFALLALASQAWGHLGASAGLVVFSLTSSLLAVAVCLGGRPGLRAALLPAILILLACPLPPPLYNAIVWQLQSLSASAAHVIMLLLGFDVSLSGVSLTRDGAEFLVVEQCSGLRGIRTLFVASIVVRELSSVAGFRSWLIVAFAPILGILLNVARVAVIVLSSNPEALSDDSGHLVQGMLMLVVGVVVLFGVGSLGAAPLRERPQETAPPSEATAGARWVLASLGGLLLVAISWLVSPWEVPRALPSQAVADFPLTWKRWRGEEADADRLFLGQVPVGVVRSIDYRLYADGRPQPTHVHLFLGAATDASARPYSNKLLTPGRGWTLVERDRRQLPALFREVEIAVSERDGERALSYSWLLRGDGLAVASLRSFLGLDRGPFADRERAVVVRISAPMHQTEVDRSLVEHALNVFVHAFHPHLSAL